MVYLILFVVLVVIIAVVKSVSSGGGKAADARLRGYGIVVDGDLVKRAGRPIGPLAGAHAEVSDGTSRHTITRVVTVAGALTKKTDAVVTVACVNGGIHQEKIEGAGELRRAQAWVARFNVLAAAEEMPGRAAGMSDQAERDYR